MNLMFYRLHMSLSQTLGLVGPGLHRGHRMLQVVIGPFYQHLSLSNFILITVLLMCICVSTDENCSVIGNICSGLWPVLLGVSFLMF